jgi:pyrimidine-nucleoside phosphorylase
MFKLSNGTAFEKFRQMVIAQGGDVSYIDHPEKFPVAMYKADVKSTATGYISRINALDIGLDAMKLGAGRETADDKIDYAAGIVLRKKVGDKVTKGDILATLYTERPNFEDIQKDIAASFNMSADPIRVHPIIWDSVK